MSNQAAMRFTSTLILTIALFSQETHVFPVMQKQHRLPTFKSFDEAVADMEKGGIKLKDKVETSLDNVNQHVIALFEEEELVGSHKTSTMHLRIYESRAGRVYVLASGWDEILRFNEMNNRDVNGDGTREVVVNSVCRGTGWECHRIVIYQVKNHKAVNLTAHIGGTLVPAKLEDLNGDGISELIATDSKWEEYHTPHIAHVNAPRVTEIFKWENGAYRKASREFPSYYEATIRRLKDSIRKAQAEGNANTYITDAINLFLNYVRKGEAGKGWQELNALLRADTFKDEEWQDERPTILKDFRKELPTSRWPKGAPR